MNSPSQCLIALTSGKQGVPTQGRRPYFPTTLTWRELLSLPPLRHPTEVDGADMLELLWPRGRSEKVRALIDREQRGGLGPPILIGVYGDVGTRVRGPSWSLRLGTDSTALVIQNMDRFFAGKQARLSEPWEIPVVFVWCRNLDDLIELAGRVNGLTPRR